MSKTVKTIARIALPIAAIALPIAAPLTMAALGGGNAILGSALTGAALSGAGSAIAGNSVGQSFLSAGLGGLGAGLSGGGAAELTGAAGLTGTAAKVAGGALTGAAYGGATGGLEGAATGAVLGGVGGGLLDTGGAGEVAATGNEPLSTIASSTGAPMTTTANLSSLPSGSLATGAGTASAMAPAASSSSLSSALSNPWVKGALSVGNQLITDNTVDATKEAAQLQSASIDKALAANEPYTQAGQQALNQIQTINANPTAYVQNNDLYKSLAAEAEQRLTANQAAKGKLGSGGTASALQDQLLQIGSGLVQGQLTNLQNTANMGQTATGNVSNLLTKQGDVNSAGVMGVNNAQTSGYQNQINTLLALANLNKTPSYAPTAMISR